MMLGDPKKLYSLPSDNYWAMDRKRVAENLAELESAS